MFYLICFAVCVLLLYWIMFSIIFSVFSFLSFVFCLFASVSQSFGAQSSSTTTVKSVLSDVFETTALINLYLTRTSGWLYMVTLSGETLTSSTNRSSRVAETGVKGACCPEGGGD